MLTLPTDVAGLLARATDADKNVRSQVATELAKLVGDEAARSTICEALDDSNDRVRLAAVRAVADWAPEVRPVEQLSRALRDPSASVRVAAVRAMGRSENGRRVAPLALSDVNPTVRAAALGAHRDVAGEDAVQLGVKCLGDPDVRVRFAAAAVLYGRGDPATRDALVRALEDQFLWVRTMAIWGLKKFGSEEVLEPLIGRLRDRNRWIRREAARALGDLEDRRAVEPLLDLLARSTSSLVQAAAVSALGRCGDRRATGPIISALRACWTADPDEGYLEWGAPRGQFELRRDATAALLRLGGPAADAEVRRLPADWVAWTREADLA
jgi:HEAT repeat protein